MAVITATHYKGQSKVLATLQDILDTAAAQQLEVGLFYQTNDANVAVQVYRAETNASLVPWHTTASVNALIDTKLAPVTTQLTTVAQGLAQEIADRQASDLLTQGAIDQEASARATADTTLQGNINSLNTTLTAALQTAVESLKDERVSQWKIVEYGDVPLSLTAIMAGSLKEGVTELSFLPANGDVNVTTTLGNLPAPFGANDTLAIKLNDRVKVTVDGGVITAVEFQPSLLQTKFASIDTTLTDLANQIANINQTGAFNVGNALGKNGTTISVSGDLTADLNFTGDKTVSFKNTKTRIEGKLQLPYIPSDLNGAPTTWDGITFREIWVDQNSVVVSIPN